MERYMIREWADEGFGVLSDENTENLESVYANLPEVYFYGWFGEQTGDQMEAYLGDEKLDFVSQTTFEETGAGIYYYVLLDISGSIPQSYFNEIKEGILEIQKNLRGQDRLILCSFGEEVTLLSDGNSDEAGLREILETLDNEDQQTLLFEAMAQMSNLADGIKAEECRRRVMIVFSDGEDIAVGKKQAQEALKNLTDKGIPLYAMCIKETDRANINSFGEFARNTGGRLVLLEKGGILQASDDLTEQLLKTQELKFSADGNQVTNQKENAVLRFTNTDKTLSREVENVRWIPDTTAPVIENGATIGDRQIRLVFSEPVNGTENISNYRVRCGERDVPISGISQSDQNSDTVVLSLAENLETGTYYIECTNVTDNSMEKNPVENTIEVVSTVSEQPPETENDSGPVLLLVLVLMILTIVIAASVSKIGKKKKETKKTEENTPFSLKAQISMEGKPTVYSQWKIEDRLVVGRGKSCDIQVEDSRVSTMHFALERIGNRIYITDLKSTNGSSVNKVKLQPGQRIEVNPEELIEAGPLSVRLRW